jgi:hypothetical protein
MKGFNFFSTGRSFNVQTVRSVLFCLAVTLAYYERSLILAIVVCFIYISVDISGIKHSLDRIAESLEQDDESEEAGE